MLRTKKSCGIILLCAGLGFLVSACSSLPLIPAERVSSPITIDGWDRDWEHTSAYSNKSYPAVLVRTSHDDNFFYLCLSTRDREMQIRMLAFGLTVWLDPLGSDHKTFGIAYPLPEKMVLSDPPMQRSKKKGFNEMPKIPDEAFQELEIIGPRDEDRYRLPAMNNEGIAARVGLSEDGVMAYELRMPLHSSKIFPRAINPVADSIIGLGIVGGEMKLPTGPVGTMPMPPGDGGGMDFGGDGPQPGMPPGGGRMMPGGPPREGGLPEPIKMWWRVELER